MGEVWSPYLTLANGDVAMAVGAFIPGPFEGTLGIYKVLGSLIESPVFEVGHC
jgi:hypothetical protein